MPDMVCCFKWVVDEAYIRPGSSGNLEMEWAEHKLSDYDRNAIEAAVQLQEAYGGSIAAVTAASPDATKGVKDALSRGPEQAFFINGEGFENLEPAQTSVILADVISRQVKYDIILCGEGSSDLYAQQVGPRLAEKLKIPCICFVQKIEIKDREVIVERKTDDGIEVLSVPMPVLLTVLPDCNNPRIPGLKDTLGASRKPVTEVSEAELEVNYEKCLVTQGMRAANLERSCVRFGATLEDVQAFVEALRKTGVLDRG